MKNLMIFLCAILVSSASLPDSTVNAATKQKTAKVKVSLGDPDRGIADQFCKNHYQSKGKVALVSSL